MRNRRNVFYINGRKPYGFWSFALDVCMLCITGGLWLVWIFVREMRNQ